jgi:ubiquinone/menaquinone biosynthesis C-methylase UbiE
LRRSDKSVLERRRIRYVHGLGEACGLPDDSIDLVSYQFVVHECPEAAIRAQLAEARRVLRPGGVLMIVDNDPRYVQACKLAGLRVLLGQSEVGRYLSSGRAGEQNLQALAVAV